MQKILKGLLILIIIFLALVIIIKVESVGPDTNYFNTHFRENLARVPFLRRFFKLDYDGDSRSDYLGNRFSKILIEVDAMQGENLDLELFDRLTKAVSQITGKQTDYIISNTDIPQSETTEEDAAKIQKQYQNAATEPNTASLYLLVLSRKKDEPKQIGSTLGNNAIILYAGSVEDFTERAAGSFRNYLFSTLLHEFGHQIGLGHNNEPGCLMNPKAEINDIARLNPDDVVTNFCPSELSEISSLKSLEQ